MQQLKRNSLIIFSVILSSILTGCMSFSYSPTIYDLPQGRIAPFEISGKVSIKNDQTSDKTIKSTGGGHTWNYNLHDVTEGFINQFNVEIKNVASIKPSKENKSLSVFISEMKCGTKGLNTWVRKCTIKGWLKLGASEKVLIDSAHGNPVISTMEKALDGMIAIAVQDTLKNSAVLGYLKK